MDPHPDLIAGFDAGQTHTTCRLADAGSGRVLSEGRGPGVSHLAAPNGPQRFQAALRRSLADALRQRSGGASGRDDVAARAAGVLAGNAAQPRAGGAARSATTAGGMGPDSARVDALARVQLQPHREPGDHDAVPASETSGDADAALAVPPPLLTAAIGASGIEMGTAVQRQGLQLAAEALGLSRQRLWVGGDERTALRGAFPDGAGIVVISGTGTIAVGRDAAGQEHRCAGWGWLLDGAGSAFDIGRDGLTISLQMADGRRPEGPLRQVLWSALELDPADPETPQQIKAMVVQAGFMPAGLAALAPLVETLAAEGDREAIGVLRIHAEALVHSVAAVAMALRLQEPPVATLGGAITHLPCFRRLFCEELQRLIPEAQLQVPAGDAVRGALAIARELLKPGEGGG